MCKLLCLERGAPFLYDIIIAMLPETGFSPAVLVASTAFIGFTFLILIQMHLNKDIQFSQGIRRFMLISLSWSLVFGAITIMFSFIWFDYNTPWTITWETFPISGYHLIAWIFFVMQFFSFLFCIIISGLLRLK